MKELLSTGVAIPLEYNEEYDALIGKVKDYSVAVKENLETASYGCLFWIKEGNFAAITDAQEYLTDQQKLNPAYIKKFRVTEQGAAVALNRVDDSFTNISELKRFIYDFVTSLSLNFYENCCCECGETDKLAIYSAGGVIAQACVRCGAKYKYICECDGKIGTAPVVPATEQTVSAAQEVLKEAEMPVEEPKNEIISEKAEESFDDLVLTEIKQEPAAAETYTEPVRYEQTENMEELNSLLFTAEEEKQPERPKSKLFEEAEREFQEEKARLAAQKADYNLENEMNELLIDESGAIAIKEVAPEVNDGSADVTEIRDDSHDGEDFDVEEIESTVTKATVTTGHPQLAAEETPLEKDGSVPLINPNSHREERHVSPVDGPDAVQPLEFGQSAIICENLDASEKEEQEALPPGYASGEDMGRDGEGVISPPPYNPSYNYSTYNRKITFAEKSNLFMGIIGSLVLGFVGAAIWVFFGGVLNIISYWGSLAIVASVYGGYYLGGRALDKKGIVVSFILSLAMTIVGVVLVSSLEMVQWLEETYYVKANIKEGFEWFMWLMEYPDSSSAFGSNLVISLIITLIADIIMAVRMWKKA